MSIEIVLMMVFVAVALLLLRVDAHRITDADKIKVVASDDEKDVCIATHIVTKSHKDSKIVMVIYHMVCPECESGDVVVELSDDEQKLRIVCNECSSVVRIPLIKILPTHEKSLE